MTIGTPLSAHFTAEEFRCQCDRPECPAPTRPSQVLIERLEVLRARLGKPLQVVSGTRCDYWNRMIGGEANSAHLTGEAADLKVDTSRDVYWLMGASLQGELFHRVGYGRRDRDQNLTFHVDVSQTNPQRVIWTY